MITLDQQCTKQNYKDLDALFSALPPQALILTPNLRLSRHLHQHYGEFKNRHASAWQNLNCLSLLEWQEQQWRFAQNIGLDDEAQKYLLSTKQSQIVWRKIIQQAELESFLGLDTLVDLAQNAWQILANWGIDWKTLPEDLNEVVLFKQWAQHYEQQCRTKSCLDTALIPSLILRWIKQHKLVLPEQLCCIGFDELTPVIQSIFNECQKQKTNIIFWDLNTKSNCRTLSFTETSSEIETALRWAAQHIEEAQAKNQKVPRIGIVIPQLAQLRPWVAYMAERYFCPSLALNSEERQAPGFTLSAGQPLAQTPILAAALAALKINAQHYDRDLIDHWLLSPFLGLSIELAQRQKTSIHLRQHYTQVTRNDYIYNLNKYNHCSAWTAGYQQALQYVLDDHTKKTYAEWATLFDAQIHAMGWPGDRHLDTLEYQQAQHWPKLINQLAELTRIDDTTVTWQDAWTRLNQLAYVPFHPETKVSPLLILGVLEAAGLDFDYLWITGMDDGEWPNKPQANPLLPLDFQRQHQMPRTSAERELRLAKKLIERFSTSAQHTYFSYSLSHNSQPKRMSRLIKEFATLDSQSVTTWTPKFNLFDQPFAAQNWIDETARPLDPSFPIRGGTQILKNQSACPFKAFAAHRLNILSLNEKLPGMAKWVRGQWLHKTLELIWTHIQDQKQLQQLDQRALTNFLHHYLIEAWNNNKECSSLPMAMQDIEVELATPILLTLFEIEKNRSPFKIQALEKEFDAQILTIPIKIRCDRIDELNTGETVLIDYKTKECNLNEWMGHRPAEPQMPLYATLFKPLTQGIMYGQLHTKKVDFIGICNTETDLPTIKSPDQIPCPSTNNNASFKNWADVIDYWQLELNQLAKQFLQGHAEVNPKNTAVCTRCTYTSICRIFQQATIQDNPVTATEENNE